MVSPHGLRGFTFILEVVETLQFHRMVSLHKIPTPRKVHFRNVKGAGRSPLQKIPEMETVRVKTPHVQAPAALTNGGLTELLSSHLAGNVGSHQHTDVNAHLLSDDVGDEFQPLRALIYALQGVRNSQKNTASKIQEA